MASTRVTADTLGSAAVSESCRRKPISPARQTGSRSVQRYRRSSARHTGFVVTYYFVVAQVLVDRRAGPDLGHKRFEALPIHAPGTLGCSDFREPLIDGAIDSIRNRLAGTVGQLANL